MTLQEIQNIAKTSVTYDLDFPSQMDEYYEKVYMPVRKAVANNDKVVINFILTCNEKEQDRLLTAVEAGAIDGQHPEAIALCKKMCEEQGVEIDDRVMISKIAV